MSATGPPPRRRPRERSSAGGSEPAQPGELRLPGDAARAARDPAGAVRPKRDRPDIRDSWCPPPTRIQAVRAAFRCASRSGTPNCSSVAVAQMSLGETDATTPRNRPPLKNFVHRLPSKCSVIPPPAEEPTAQTSRCAGIVTESTAAKPGIGENVHMPCANWNAMPSPTAQRRPVPGTRSTSVSRSSTAGKGSATGTNRHDVPFQCSKSGPPVMKSSPTAHTSRWLTASTAARLPRCAGAGTTCHDDPSQCSVNGRPESRSSPTAQASDAVSAATPNRRSPEPGCGTGTACHAPFTNRSAIGRLRLLKFSAPTAQAWRLPGTAATSVSRPSSPAGCGVETR